MLILSKKSEVVAALEKCLVAYHQEGLSKGIIAVEEHLLKVKVKFPLLEYCGQTLFDKLKEEEIIPFCDAIAAKKTEGGNVILGILLQIRLKTHFEESFKKAVEYIMLGNIWYACDIIGERVFGKALLENAEQAISSINQLSKHPSPWVRRALGAGSHYAIKKGLGEAQVALVFEILLAMAVGKNQAVKQGVGWAAKTTAKFHPTIIQTYQTQIEAASVPNWFRKKIQIGLDYHVWKNNFPRDERD